MLIYLVRHGETGENSQRIIQGQLDTKLNMKGIQQAQRVARRFASETFDMAFCSDLSRAKKTAEIIVQQHVGLELKSSEELRERFMGSSQGERWHPGYELASDVESTCLFVERIFTWWDGLLELDKFHNSENGKETVALVVGHGAWIGHLLHHLSKDRAYEILDGAHDGRRPGGECWYIENASIQVVRVTEVTGSRGALGVILKSNDIEHLQGLDLVNGNADLTGKLCTK